MINAIYKYRLFGMTVYNKILFIQKLKLNFYIKKIKLRIFPMCFLRDGDLEIIFGIS